MISRLQEKFNFTLHMNHLLVVYAFLIPISTRGKSAVLSLILVFFLLRGNYIYYLKKAIGNKIVQACLLFFVVHIIWLIGTENFSYAENIIKDMKYLLYPLLFLCFVDKRYALRIITAFTLGVFYSEIVSYLISFSILPEKLYLFGYELYKSSVHDPAPFLGHIRHTVLLSIAIGIILYNILEFKYTSVVKTFFIMFLLSASTNMVLVGGRTGYMSFIVIVLFVIFLKYKLNIKAFFLTLFTVLVFFIAAYNFSGIFERKVNQTFKTLNTLVTSESPNIYNSSLGLRVGVWLYSIDTIKENVFFGVGTGDHLDEVKSTISKEHKYIKRLNTVHSEYLKNLLQFGLIGFLFFLNIFYQIFKFKSENYYKKNILLIVTVGLICAIIPSVMGGVKIYLPLLVTIIAATVSNNTFLNNDYKKINIKQIFIYFLLILISTTIAILQ